MAERKQRLEDLAKGLDEANRVEKELDAQDQAEDELRGDELAKRLAAQPDDDT
jgi:hypothetical protein